MALRGPQLLKDFLASDSNSCSSSGFRSFPRKPYSNQTVRNLIELDLTTTTNRNQISPIKLTRSRSKAASATIHAVHRASEIFSNAVRHLPFNSVKPRRRLFGEKRRNDGVPSSAAVRVKDILRWRSFRDLVEEEESPPLDFASSPLRCATTTTTTGSTTSKSTSWCDSDFTAEDLPSWGGNSGVGGRESTVDPKGKLSCEEKEQHSPVSVLNFPFQEDEESVLSFHQSESNLEMRKHLLIEDIQHFESLSTDLEDQFSLDEYPKDCKGNYDMDCDENAEKGHGTEEKAKQLLNLIKATRSEADVDQLLLDFFIHELATSRYRIDECEMLRVAKDWMGGQYEESYEWEVEGKREAYVRDMERGERWRKFEEEREELAMEMEVEVLDCLVDEILVDELSCSLKRQQAIS